jgi:hypothetical protein
MSNSQELMLKSLTKYFKSNLENEKTFVNIITGKYNVSLRLLDWLVTHYAKANNIIYWINLEKDTLEETAPKCKKEAANMKKIILYIEYRAQLKSYTKYNFDPFRRHERIQYHVGKENDRIIETTIGQMNFFRWVFENKILDFAKFHSQNIVKHMSKGKKSKDSELLSKKISHNSCQIISFC